ncbi:MAG: asparaginase domain-containing protein [Alphaproteobacteria bacterium]
MKNAIHFIMTGGTIDSYFEPTVATTIPSKESIIHPYLKDIIKPYTNVTYEVLCMRDSRDLTDTDKEALAVAIKKSTVEKIIVTHGTDTMVETADLLAQQKTGKTVVLMGSFIPLQHFALSDAGFNLGFALYAVQALKPGVYICMNAEVFEAGHVAKDKPNARFVKK